MISNEDVYINQICYENWYQKTQYFDIFKINLSKKSIIEFSNKLEKHCTPKVFNHVLSKPDLFTSKNAKKLCRNGVPIKYIREFLIKMFNTNLKYKEFEIKWEAIFKEYNTKYLKDYVPYFTGMNTLEESLPIHFLNEEGILILKEILWMLNSVVPIIEHSPLVIKITSLVLIFCSKIETYEIMKTLLEINYKSDKIYTIRWHFRFIFNDNYKIITSIVQSLKNIASSVRDVIIHFDQINFQMERLIEDMVFGFFMNYFNFIGIIKLLPLFLNEGIKILYRLIYAILKVFKQEILKITSPDEVIKEIRKICLNINDFKQLYDCAFSYKLTRNNNRYSFQRMPENDLYSTNRNFYYLPKYNKQSSILKDYDILNLWSILPLNIKIRDAEIIFQSSENGYSIKSIYDLNNLKSVSSLSPYVMNIIETTEGEIFGFLSSNMIKNTKNKFFRPIDNYLFTIRPECNLYYEKKMTDYICYGDDECIILINGRIGPALRIEENLSSGVTFPNEFYESPALSAKNKFYIKNFEIIILI